MRRPFSIFCDWSMHDELGDAIDLDEAITFSALDTLERWQRDFAVSFDYYLLDAFWFDPASPYTAFKQPHWPHGFETALARILELGMQPGLWYDVNASFFKLAGWSASLDKAGLHIAWPKAPTPLVWRPLEIRFIYQVLERPFPRICEPRLS